MARRPPTTRAPKPGRTRTTVTVAAGAMLVLGLAIGVVLWRSIGGDEATTTGPEASASAAGGSAVVAGVTVVQVLADSGRVPLNTPVERSWTLVNTGPTVVTLGKPTIEVLEGC